MNQVISSGIVGFSNSFCTRITRNCFFHPGVSDVCHRAHPQHCSRFHSLLYLRRLRGLSCTARIKENQTSLFIVPAQSPLLCRLLQCACYWWARMLTCGVHGDACYAQSDNRGRGSGFWKCSAWDVCHKDVTYQQ